jgi:hypothetical protein
MHDLNQIRKMNELAETKKSQSRARAMNTKESHPKKSLAARLKTVPTGACPALDKLR